MKRVSSILLQEYFIRTDKALWAVFGYTNSYTNVKKGVYLAGDIEDRLSVKYRAPHPNS